MDLQSPLPGTPRWVKISAAAALALILLVVVMLLVGGAGDHGPGRHLGGDDTPASAGDAPEGHEPPAWVPEH